MPPEDFTRMISRLWKQVLPLYENLHCYAGQKLAKVYGADKVLLEDGLLPSHLFGNMWSQDWININDIMIPYPDVPPIGKLDENNPKRYQSPIKGSKVQCLENA
jgi:peptidyl-dipeptidase A